MFSRKMIVITIIINNNYECEARDCIKMLADLKWLEARPPRLVCEVQRHWTCNLHPSGYFQALGLATKPMNQNIHLMICSHNWNFLNLKKTMLDYQDKVMLGYQDPIIPSNLLQKSNLFHAEFLANDLELSLSKPIHLCCHPHLPTKQNYTSNI